MSTKHEAGHRSHRHGHSREGAKQPEVFNPARAALLDDPQRFEYMAPADVLKLLDAPEGSVVIDFGAGTGTYSIEIARRRPDLKIVALDEQPGMIELMKAKPAMRQLTNIQPMLSGELGSIIGTADRILALNVLHEVGDDALREMSQLLKPGGSALIIDWDGEMDRPIGPPKGHTHSIAEARDRLTAAGFEAESLEHLRYHFVLRATRPAKIR